VRPFHAARVPRLACKPCCPKSAAAGEHGVRPSQFQVCRWRAQRLFAEHVIRMRQSMPTPTAARACHPARAPKTEALQRGMQATRGTRPGKLHDVFAGQHPRVASLNPRRRQGRIKYGSEVVERTGAGAPPEGARGSRQPFRRRLGRMWACPSAASLEASCGRAKSLFERRQKFREAFSGRHELTDAF
jgi:hypothetical protein